MIPSEHITKFLCYALRHENWYARADTHDLHMRNFAQPAQQLFQNLRSQHQRIATRKQDIPNLWCILDVINLHLEFMTVESLARVANDTRAGAITAVGSTLSCYQHQHTIRVAMHQPWHRRMPVFGQGIFHHRRKSLHLFGARNDLLAHRILRVIWVDE